MYYYSIIYLTLTAVTVRNSMRCVTPVALNSDVIKVNMLLPWIKGSLFSSFDVF